MIEKLDLCALNDTDRTVTVAVDGVRYEYWLGDRYWDTTARVKRYLRRGRRGQALNFLKARAVKTDRLG